MKPIFTFFNISMLAILSVTILMVSVQAQEQPITLQTKDKLIVGMTGEQPPFNFVSLDEKIVGFDVELANIFAKEMKRELQIETMPLSQLLLSLEHGKVDIVISGLAVTEQRKKQAIFSIPYALANKSILTTKNNIKRIYESTGFNDQSVKLVALNGSTSEALAKKRLANAQLSTVEHYEDGILAILAGEADGMIADLAVCELVVFRDTTNELTLLKRSIGTENIAVAIAKNNQTLQKQVNFILTTFSEQEIEELYQKWFNDGGWLPLVP